MVKKNEKEQACGNPFVKYRDNFGPIKKKYSKKNNDPEIKTLKYLDKKWSKHIDISNNYKNTKNKSGFIKFKTI